MSTRMADMTLEELQTLVEAMVESKLLEHQAVWYPMPRRPISEVLDSMKRNLISPDPASPSALELLREDRDR